MARRGNSEGSAYFEKDRKKWCAAIPLPGGKVKRLRFDRQTDANKALRKGLQARDQGRLVMGPRQTVGQFLTHWLEDTAKPTIRESTYRRYEHAIQRTIAPSVGRVPLTGLTPQHVQSFQNKLLAAGSAPRSVIKARLVLSSALDQAERWGFIPRNPVRLVDPPRVPEQEHEPIAPEQAHALLDAV